MTDEVNAMLTPNERLAYMRAVQGEASERKWIEENHGAAYLGGPWSDCRKALEALAEERRKNAELTKTIEDARWDYDPDYGPD